MTEVATGTIHHIELWVPDLTRAEASWGWLLEALGYQLFQQWPVGQSWKAGETYIVIEQSPARSAFRHDRCRPGLNHVAFHVATSDSVEDLVAGALGHGWRLMFADRHPYAGGDQHYAAYLENRDGYEVELVAPSPAEPKHGPSEAKHGPSEAKHGPSEAEYGPSEAEYGPSPGSTG